MDNPFVDLISPQPTARARSRFEQTGRAPEDSAVPPEKRAGNPFADTRPPCSDDDANSSRVGPTDGAGLRGGPALPAVPAPTQLSEVPVGRGGGGGFQRCRLMPQMAQLGVCMYQCPNGDARRLGLKGPLGCPTWIDPSHGLGPND